MHLIRDKIPSEIRLQNKVSVGLLKEYSIVRRKATILLSTSTAWPAWVGCSWAELFSQPDNNIFAQPYNITYRYFDILVDTSKALKPSEMPTHCSALKTWSLATMNQ